MMLYKEGIRIIFEAESPWLHVGICRRVLSPKLYSAFEDANSAIGGAQGPASEIPFSSCSS